MPLQLHRRHRKECEAGHPEDSKSGQFDLSNFPAGRPNSRISRSHLVNRLDAFWRMISLTTFGILNVIPYSDVDFLSLVHHRCFRPSADET